jgi:predicted metal-dependent HD superfamily phosphohydrolase
LGADEPVYRDYAAKIRQEYAWVPEPQYREGRRRVLERFLSRVRIYQFLERLEGAARRNLAAEIVRLEGA